MRRGFGVLVTALLVVAATSPAGAYLKLGTPVDGRIIDVTWRGPVRYFVSEANAPTASAGDLRNAVARATGTWQAVPSATVRFEYQGMTTASPGMVDGLTTVGFLDQPDLDRVLAATSFLIDTTNGAIIEADVFFNSQFAWSVSAEGSPSQNDLESVALHELGHLLGLSHSALGETELTSTGGRRVVASGSIMFPIAMSRGTIADRVLQADDIAGISDLYPAAGVVDSTGGITGRVTKGGRGLLGAHVVAINPETGVVVGNFSLNENGEFAIVRLEPGPYILRVEPLDDTEVDSFFSTTIDVNFRVAYAPRMVVAPRGGSSSPIEIQVIAK